MGRYCEFCKQSYEEGFFWKHIENQHPISCSNVQNSYAQFKLDTLNDDEMYTRIACHLFHCGSCCALKINNHNESITEAVAEAADYYFAISTGKTLAEWHSIWNAPLAEWQWGNNWNAPYGDVMEDLSVHPQEEIGQEVYDGLKKFLGQLNLLIQDASGFKDAIRVEDVSVDSDEYGLGARLKMEIVCPLKERFLIVNVFATTMALWSLRGFSPDCCSFCAQEDEERTIGYIKVIKE
ncbi:MAG: hypothetical protein HZA35_02790 [Parcubacteria group bacterium]|nr:hypothetical protein [Parcubacteria group bacterium]